VPYLNALRRRQKWPYYTPLNRLDKNYSSFELGLPSNFVEFYNNLLDNNRVNLSKIPEDFDKAPRLVEIASALNLSALTKIKINDEDSLDIRRAISGNIPIYITFRHPILYTRVLEFKANFKGLAIETLY
ncbi:hypothetical protein N7507_010383, partial [Penicillium longicatenatum]